MRRKQNTGFERNKFQSGDVLIVLPCYSLNKSIKFVQFRDGPSKIWRWSKKESINEFKKLGRLT